MELQRELRYDHAELTPRGMVTLRDRELNRKIANDIKTRLCKDGLPRNPNNDYERHLYARWLRLHGKTASEVKDALLLIVEDIPEAKRNSYISDILQSVIVGFPEKKADPMKVGG